MGYAEESKAYRIWNTTKDKIVISRDVIFHESCNPAPSSLPPPRSLPSPVTIHFSKLLAIMPAIPTLSLPVPASPSFIDQPLPLSTASSPSVSPLSAPISPASSTSPVSSLPPSSSYSLSPSAESLISPDSLNSEIRTKFLSNLLNPAPNPTESDPQNHLDL
jgi:hypothetical protein